MSTTVQAPKKRKRVPDELRRRAAISCDRCKLRRAKCIRATVQDPCSSCISNHVKCESTLPRKQRVYGSLESLSLRYRALEALVKGLFPEENTQDTDVLYRIAAERGVSMPPADSMTPVHEIFGQQSPPQQQKSPIQTVPGDTSGSGTAQDNPFAGRSPNKPAAEEKLIPTPNGVALYVGPSSSFSFAAIARAMVARCSPNPHSGQSIRQQKAERADFITLRASKALEIRDQEQDGEEEDDDSASSSQDSPSNKQPVKTSSSPFSPKKFHELAGVSKSLSNEGLLPPRDVSDALVRAFFDKVHPDYAIFHRSMFQLRYEAIWEKKVSSLREVDPGWICCLSMVFVFGAQVLEEHDKDQAMLIQRRYLALARSFIGRLISTASLLHVQALLLLQLHEHNTGERNAAWMLLGSALRMAISLGMHREGTNSGFDPIERNTRKRVWWTLYMFEQQLSIILGRPTSINDCDVTTSLPEESIFDTTDTPPSYMDHLLRLTRLSSKVKSTMYAHPESLSAEEIPPDVSRGKSLIQELDNWRNELPPHLLPDWNSMISKQRRAVIMLHVYYHYTRVLITRPFLVNKVKTEIGQLERQDMGSSSISEDTRSLTEVCNSSADETIICVNQLAEAGLLNGISWLDVYYLYHSVFILCLNILGKPADAMDSPAELSRKIAIRSVMEMIRATKLSPTFRILIGVADQFARVSGALDDPNETRDEKSLNPTEEATLPSPHLFPAQTSMPEFQSQSFQQPSASEWLQSYTSFGWDLFDIGGYMPNQGETPYPLSNDAAFLHPPSVGAFASGPWRDPDGQITPGEANWAARALRDISRGVP